jgi:hypothetical protein
LIGNSKIKNNPPTSSFRDKIYRKEIEPPFIPQLTSEIDTSYFDQVNFPEIINLHVLQEFTSQQIYLTPPKSALDTVEEEEMQNLQANFVHFSFKNAYPSSLREDMLVD